MSSIPPRSTTFDVLPPLYARWMDELLAGPIAPETNATCADCAMCRKGDTDLSQANFWEADVKCCSYQPRLANFLVGGALLDDPGDDSVARAGRAQLEARIDAGIAVSPLGVHQNPAYMLLYKGAQNAFGKSRALRCPHWVDERGGMCGIWRHRESTCATFFCKHVRGAVGKDFWSTIQQLLANVENNLSLWCVLEVEVGIDALKRIMSHATDRDRVGAEQLDGRLEHGVSKALWGTWHGREREFYMECARRVQAMRWEDVERVCGPGLHGLVKLAHRAYAAVNDTSVPARLGMAPVQIVRAKSPTGDRVARLTSYSPNDPLVVPERLATALQRFDGTRATNDVIFDIVAEERMGVNRALIRRLVDFGVLVEMPEPAEPAAAPGPPSTPSHATAEAEMATGS